MSFKEKKRKLQGFPALNYEHRLLEGVLDLVPLAYRLESLSYKCSNLTSTSHLQRCISCSGITMAHDSPSVSCPTLRLAVLLDRPGTLLSMGQPTMGRETAVSILFLPVQRPVLWDSYCHEGKELS